ncbi:protein PIN-LIKES 3 isoform X1 [Cajanus cajan]|uniref:Transporter C5D6.04 n=1 Tax=Cajanus cajan TaxID=3821 RepID=A0A151RX36_CAJCA|nr:protein PIN-LIKES 3 isoform X1 [Cajanus cajan]XP_020235384.1 protein PIN-LIKES 3 isoform X1 [Cajanus cajan]XP_020235385.1 protein PIN-LIKES 3 isoform X1 [Cajanus cajan]XP_029130559.1 protein PIN-LIKES 3 isoform X1 [Cajanus cajan]XP_029130560.1 protein PIN-LIKES 3 isoform X1 [Cajanus cajan]XP_029130561.1 protein PIN-LIKES 3 isoform X1 [Cajanus cajan]KYP47037.1 putative transporter C5D6.04 [Cajanus cajan]
MEFLKLFIVALMPVLKVLLITLVGTILAINRFNILGETARKNLNTLVYIVFSPTLVCSSLAETITLRNVVKLWFMPVNILITFLIGTVLGLLVVKLTRVPPNLQGLVLGCCAAGNLGNLPIIIVPAVCKQSGSPFGDVNVCYKNALAYASLSMALGSVYIWSYAYNLVRLYSPKISKEIKVDDGSMVNLVLATKTDPENPSTCSTGLPVVTADDRSQPENHVKQFEIQCTMRDGQVEEVPKKKTIVKQLTILVDKINLKVLFTPSTIGAIVGLVIGIVPQFRKLLIGDSAPLRVILESVVMLGYASIPAMTLLVGANLIKGLNALGKQLPLVIGVIVVKCIVLPALGVGIVKAAIRLGLIHRDPLYEFLLLLQFALPPAVTMSTITQLFGAGEGECSIIMFATYSFAAVSVTLWSTFYMWLVL